MNTPDMDEGNKLGRSYLLHGAKANSTSVISKVLSAYPEAINDTDPGNGLTALHYAAGQGSAKAVEMLLGCPGVRLDIQDFYGRDALDVAILSGHEGVINMLFRVRAEQAGLAGEPEDKPSTGKSGHVIPFKPGKPAP